MMYNHSVCLLPSGAKYCNHSLALSTAGNYPINEQCFTHYWSTLGSDCLACTSVVTVRIIQYLPSSFSHNFNSCQHQVDQFHLFYFLSCLVF